MPMRKGELLLSLGSAVVQERRDDCVVLTVGLLGLSCRLLQ